MILLNTGTIWTNKLVTWYYMWFTVKVVYTGRSSMSSRLLIQQVTSWKDEVERVYFLKSSTLLERKLKYRIKRLLYLKYVQIASRAQSRILTQNWGYSWNVTFSDSRNRTETVIWTNFSIIILFRLSELCVVRACRRVDCILW